MAFGLRLRVCCITLMRVELHPAPRRHGVLADFLGDEPERWLVIGSNRAGKFLELVVLTTAEGGQLVIHAMPLRPKYRRLLEP